jgi:hypothetical protein
MVRQISFGNIHIALNQLYQTLQVINYIHQANLDLSPMQTDGEYHVATHCRLCAKHLFDSGSDFRFRPV